MNDQPNPAPSGNIFPPSNWESVELPTEAGAIITKRFDALISTAPKPAPPRPAPEQCTWHYVACAGLRGRPLRGWATDCKGWQCGDTDSQPLQPPHKVCPQCSRNVRPIDGSSDMGIPTSPAPEPTSMGNPIDPAPDRHEASRQAFESAFRPPSALPQTIERDSGGRYIHIHHFWTHWCRALDHAAQEQPQRNPVLGHECPKCGTIPLNLPPEAEKEIRALFPELEQPAPDGSAVEWVQDKTNTLKNGEWSILPEDALELAQRCDRAERMLSETEQQLADRKWVEQKLNSAVNEMTAKLAAAERRVERLREVLRLIQWSGGGHTDEGLYCNGSWCAEQARAALAETKEDASNE